MNINDIKELIKLISESKINKIKIKKENFELSLEKEVAKKTEEVIEVVNKQVSKEVTNQQVVEKTKSETNNTQKKDIVTLNSPMVGTFYEAPSPGAKPYVKVGDTVSKGQTIAIIEAMKIMNEWEADFDCKIVKVLVENSQPVEYGMPIFEVEKI